MSDPPPSPGPTPAGITLRVRVQPRASADRAVGWRGEILKVAAAGPPAEGEANRRLVAYLARTLRVPKTAITIVSGRKSRDKTLLIAPAASVVDVGRRLRELGGAGQGET